MEFAGDIALIESFTSELIVSKSANTALAYKADITLLHKFLTSQQKGFAEASKDDIYQYFVEYIIKNNANILKPLEATSFRRKISSISKFFDFLIRNNVCSENPLLYFDKPKIGTRIPVFLEQDEISFLLEEAKKDNTKHGIRDYTILEMLYSSGMRITECLTLKISDVISEKGVVMENIIIKGKGEKERVVFLNKRSREAVKRYMTTRDDESSFLFSSKKSASGHVSRENFFHSLKKMTAKHNIYQDISPHKIRHSFATHLYRSGIDIKFLQALLGHSDITTTECYTHVGNDDLINAVTKFHPASRSNVA